MKKMILMFISFVLVPLAAMSQVRVEGNVKDSFGDPVPGLNVYVKTTTIGTITDVNGDYVLTNVPVDGILVFSAVGMVTQEIRVGNQTRIEVVMFDDVTGLDEVVVVGYGTVKRRDLTGAVASVKGDELTMAPVANTMEALQGRVAGMDISRTSGRAGSEPSVLLRGNRSLDLSASTAPLYIIDGIPGSISNLNTNDIETIDILKDAASTAIYGSAGANGVVIITTKQAIKGKIQVEVNSYYGINGFASYPKGLQGNAWFDFLESGFYAAYDRSPNDRNELLTAYSLSPEQLNPYIDAGKWIDWVDETLQTGVQQNHNVSIRGGNESTRGYFSLGYNSEKGIYRNDITEIATMRSGIDHVLNNWISTGIQTSLSWRDRNIRNSRINRAFSAIPLGDVYDENGDINIRPIEENDYINLIADDVPGVYANNAKQIRVTANPYFEITPIKGLSLKSILGTTLSSQRNGVYDSDRTYLKLSGSGTNKTARYSNSLGYSYIWENIVNYGFSLQDVHNFLVTGVTSWSNSQSENSYIYNEGFDYDDFIYYNIQAGLNPSGGSSYSHRKMMSYVVRANYNLKGKYLLSLSNRWDGASQLSEKWDYFPAAAAAWRISDEEFMVGTSNVISNLKLRLSYGVTGNSGISPYSSRTEVASSPYNLTLGTAQLPVYTLTQAVANQKLRWEKSYNTNIGLDFGFFNNRLEMIFEFYDTDTKGVLYNRPLPSSAGAYTSKGTYYMMSNIAEINNSGLELTVNSRNFATRNFKWNSTLTFARNKEEVKSIDLGSNIQVDDLIALGLFIGHPVNTVYGYKKLGIWQLDEEEEAALYGRVPGQIKLETVEKFDDDGVGDGGVHSYSADDRQILGSQTPDWTMGLQNSFYWKNFDLNIFMTMRWGHLIDADLLGYFKYGAQLNMPATYNYWTPTNPTNDYPQPNILGSSNDVSLRSLSIVDGSYMKIRNITLGYTLPKSLGNSFGIEKFRVYGTISNPLIYTKSNLLKDIDPESGGGDTFPLYKQVIFGVNLSF